MQSDITSTEIYQRVRKFYQSAMAAGSAQIVDAIEPAVSPKADRVAFTGRRFDSIDREPNTRICLTDLASGETKVVTGGGQNAGDRAPVFAPDGASLAFLSDRKRAGFYQPYLLRLSGNEDTIELPALPGCVEYLKFSPDSRLLLIGVAGAGADLAGMQGGGRVSWTDPNLPSWMPSVDTPRSDDLWRTLWVLRLSDHTLQQISPTGVNVWESCWLTSEKVAVIASDDPGETSWYKSELAALDINSGSLQPLYQSSDQIGVPVASPSGRRASVIESISSDRVMVFGEPCVIDCETGAVKRYALGGVDATWLCFHDDATLLVMGLHGFDSVLCAVNLETGDVETLWKDSERTSGQWFPTGAPLGDRSCVTILESYKEPPRIAIVGAGEPRIVKTFSHDGTEEIRQHAGEMEKVVWEADDGLEIQGRLILPEGGASKPLPLIMDIHGGPVWSFQSRWMGRLRFARTMAAEGYAVFYPNPRGSSGRSRAFTDAVRGDMGGADTYDYLSGIDALVKRGVADPKRLGTTGISYGGYMSNWLITQDSRFAAAVPICPISSWLSQHFTCQVPDYCAEYLNDTWDNLSGRYYSRSPLVFSKNVTTPTLQLAGALDQNTPPTEALQFHRALVETGCESVLCTYPNAGHGLRSFPEVIDATSRVCDWFLKHMPAAQDASG